MKKVSLGLLASVVLLACSYDANRLIRPASEYAQTDGARPDSQTVKPVGDAGQPDAGALARDASQPGPDTAKKQDTGVSVGNTSVDVTFNSGHAQGGMSGYGYISLGVLDTVNSPTCGGMPIGGLATYGGAMTFNSTCWSPAIVWNSSTALCVSGFIPAASANPDGQGYDVNWGILVGAAARDPVQGIGVAYKTVALTVTGWNSGSLYAVIHLDDDPSGLLYCAKMTAGAAIDLSSFSTGCGFDGGMPLDPSDFARIDKVGVWVPSVASAITLSNFCLTKITFTK